MQSNSYTQNKQPLDKTQSSNLCQLSVKWTRFQNPKEKRNWFFDHSGTLRMQVSIRIPPKRWKNIKCHQFIVPPAAHQWLIVYMYHSLYLVNQIALFAVSSVQVWFIQYYLTTPYRAHILYRAYIIIIIYQKSKLKTF